MIDSCAVHAMLHDVPCLRRLATAGTKTAGVSGGTLAAVAFNSGYSLDALYEETLANSLQ